MILWYHHYGDIMKKSTVYRVLSVITVCFWMAVIFWFSSKAAKESDAMSDGLIAKMTTIFGLDLSGEALLEFISKWQFLVRKAAHFTEYAVLGFLVANAFNSFGVFSKRWAFLSPAVSLLYAVSDEVHQYFVPGRACRFLDVSIDFCGAAVGIGLFWLLLKVIKALSKRRLENGKKNNT